jgi:hypothetical protein
MSGDSEESDPAGKYRSLVTNSDGTGLADRIRSGELPVTLSNGTVLGASNDPSQGSVETSEDNVVPDITLGRYNSSGTPIGDPGVLDDY